MSVEVVGHITVHITESLEMVVRHITLSLGQGECCEAHRSVLGVEAHISVSLGGGGGAHHSVPGAGGVVEHIAVSLGWRSTSQCPG